MKRMALGRTGLEVSALGLGCMGMSEFYGPADDAESLRALAPALELGIDFLETADAYGPYRNEELLGRFLAGRRDRVVVATKFGIVRTGDPAARAINNSPEYIRSACEASLKRLAIDVIDLYYAHRIDRAVPIEETIRAMAGLVRAGKVRAIGLSEVSAHTLRRAAAVHPIAALQSEYSLLAREPEGGVLAACREVGASLVAYSPLGRGFLTATIRSATDLPEADWRRRLPRFQDGAAAHNAALVERLAALARAQGATPAQLALAWLLAQGPEVIPIPGTRRIARPEENAVAADLQLTAATRAALEVMFPPGAAQGERYTPEGMRFVDA